MILIEPNREKYQNTSIKPSTELSSTLQYQALIFEKSDIEQMINMTEEKRKETLKKLFTRFA